MVHEAGSTSATTPEASPRQAPHELAIVPTEAGALALAPDAPSDAHQALERSAVQEGFRPASTSRDAMQEEVS